MAARDSDRYFLLEQWGLGARGGAVAGYVRANESCCDDFYQECSLTDEEWRRIEAAMCDLRKDFPQTYEIVRARYVENLFQEEILLRFSIKYHQLKTHFEGALMWVLSRYYQKNKVA